MFNWSHRSRITNPVGWSSDRHRIVLLNDCFIKLSRKYEFVAVYDFDEFIFPRTFDFVKEFYEKKTVYDCSDKKQICNRKPFEFNSTNENGYHLYNYLISLIKKDEENRPASHLAAIEFERPMTLSNTHKVETNEIEMLEAFVNQINSSTKFPIYFNMIGAFKFEIYEEHLNYVKYLIESYKRFVPCIYRDYMKDIESIDTDRVRAIYFIFKKGRRWPKSVFYSKNVRTLGIHIATEIINGSWIMKPKAINGDFCSHYRKEHTDPDLVREPIGNLKIDFEYIFFFIKKYTKFC